MAQVETVWRGIKAKCSATRYLHEPPLWARKWPPTAPDLIRRDGEIETQDLWTVGPR